MRKAISGIIIIGLLFFSCGNKQKSDDYVIAADYDMVSISKMQPQCGKRAAGNRLVIIEEYTGKPKRGSRYA
jgi:hypothetical protein